MIPPSVVQLRPNHILKLVLQLNVKISPFFLMSMCRKWKYR